MTEAEQIYDAQISPLMTQIIDICKRHKIAMVNSFYLGVDGDDGDYFCSTALLGTEYNPPESLLKANRIIRQGDSQTFAFTITSETQNA